MKVVQVPVITGIDPWTQQPITEMRDQEVRAFPFGRLIHWCNGEVLDDGESPYRRWPYALFQDIVLPGEFYAVGEPEVLKDLQLELNKRRSQMVDHASIMGNAIWIVDRHSVVDPEMFNNKPGQIVEKAQGTEVRREAPPPMQSWNMQMIELAIRDMREVSGVSGVSSGQVPKGVRSGSGFEAAQEIGNIRVRSRGKSIKGALEAIGRIMVSHIQQFYTTPRMVRIIGSAGDTHFIPFDGKTIRGDWDLTVEPGSTMSSTKAARIQQAIQLYQLQAIDKRALLEITEFPGKEAILKRMGDMGGTSIPPYPGFPGMPNKDSTDRSGYSLTTRTQPQAPPQPGPPPGGGQPGGAVSYQGGDTPPSQGNQPPPRR